MLRLPDWLIYILALGAVIWALSRVGDPADAPPALPEEIAEPLEEGPLLPGPSALDPEVLVEVGPQQSGVGTAFAIDSEGWWMTARHVVDSCKRVGLVLAARNRAIEAREVRVAANADIALLRTDQAPEALQFDTAENDFRIGQTAFHVGFPQGQPGEAVSRLAGREILVARGRYDLTEPVLAWNELGRTQGLDGTLAGISGGPVLDASGRVIGVTVAESARRGRLYTAAPSSIATFLNAQNLSPNGRPAGDLSLENYGVEADRLRRGLTVAQVVCVAGDHP
jgi:S1-C subfamily serine protease